MSKKQAIQSGVIGSYLFAIVMNFLANSIPFNQISTGEVSAKYDNLFTPASLTFGIWIVIYVWLFAFVLYAINITQKDPTLNIKQTEQIYILFIINMIANGFWLLFWHYELLIIALILIVIMLVTLSRINRILTVDALAQEERMFMLYPFSIYFGWISIATIANINAIAVDIGWYEAPPGGITWTIVVLLLAALITNATLIHFKLTTYGFVILWATLGIVIRHTTAGGFDNEFPVIITLASMVFIGTTIVTGIVFRNNAMQ